MIKTIERSYVFDNGVCIKIKRKWCKHPPCGVLDFESKVYTPLTHKPFCYNLKQTTFDGALTDIRIRYNEDLRRFFA